MNNTKSATPPTLSADFVLDRWERMTVVQRLFLTAYVVHVTGGFMQKALFIIVAGILIALLVYIASESWILALAVGVFLGWAINEIQRMFKK